MRRFNKARIWTVTLALGTFLPLGQRTWSASQPNPSPQWLAVASAAKAAADAIVAGRLGPAVLDPLDEAQHQLPPEAARPTECWDMMVDALSTRSVDPDHAVKRAHDALDCYHAAAGFPASSDSRAGNTDNGASARRSGIGLPDSGDHRDACSPPGHVGIFDEGIPERKPEAIRLVEQGCGLYLKGNAADAANLYRQAAEQYKDAVAEFRLGSLYEQGQGVARDLAQAKAWYGRASDQGMQLASNALVRLAPPLPQGGQAGAGFHARTCFGAVAVNQSGCTEKGGDWR